MTLQRAISAFGIEAKSKLSNGELAVRAGVLARKRMDKVMQVISILEQHTDATVAGSTMAMAISAVLTLMATVAIVVAAWSTARGTKQLAKIAEREEEARK